jgi:hypothetical protein
MDRARRCLGVLLTHSLHALIVLLQQICYFHMHFFQGARRFLCLAFACRWRPLHTLEAPLPPIRIQLHEANTDGVLRLHALCVRASAQHPLQCRLQQR